MSFVAARQQLSGRKDRYHEGGLMRSEFSPDIEAIASPAGHPRLNASVQSHQSQDGKSHKWCRKSTGDFDPNPLPVNSGDTIIFDPQFTGTMTIKDDEGQTLATLSSPFKPYTVTVESGTLTVFQSSSSSKKKAGDGGDGGGGKTGTITVGGGGSEGSGGVGL
ncbi:MAG TPA: hypothetical protein VH165_19675 [Kofleriaceae bacterium]|nr:hypothetical protein [Kofleriaceae bacterium]